MAIVKPPGTFGCSSLARKFAPRVKLVALTCRLGREGGRGSAHRGRPRGSFLVDSPSWAAKGGIDHERLRIALPHHKLVAFEVASELLLAVRACHIRDANLRDQASRSSRSAALNTAEGAGRVSRADKARVFGIARAEAVEAAAAVEIALLCGDCAEAPAVEVARVANRLVALLTGLCR
jgi:four helix bundle protein